MKRARLLVVTQAVKLDLSPATSKETALRSFPKTRGECEDGERPCPWILCEYHLANDVVLDRYGNPTVYKTRDWDWTKPSCALDVADEGPKSLAEVAKLLGLRRQTVHVIEQAALKKALKKAQRQG